MSKPSLRIALATAAAAALLAAGEASAQTATTSFQVTASVARKCTIAASTVAFGAYDPVGANDAAPLDQTGSLTVRCTKNTAYSVGLDAGANGAPGRNMKSAAGDLLAYELYKDAGHTSPWTAAAPGLVTGTAASKAPIPLQVFGRVPGGQDVPEGAYADTVTATVNF